MTGEMVTKVEELEKRIQALELSHKNLIQALGLIHNILSASRFRLGFILTEEMAKVPGFIKKGE